MAHLLTLMSATLQVSPTDTGTDMFGLKFIVRYSRNFVLPLCSYALHRFPFGWATVLAMLVSTTIELCAAKPSTLRSRKVALMADCS